MVAAFLFPLQRNSEDFRDRFGDTAADQNDALVPESKIQEDTAAPQKNAQENY